MFTDSVIARLPEVPVEEDAVAQLFASDARLPAPSLTPPSPAKPNAFWHEPGNTLQGGVPGPPGKPLKPVPAAAAAAMVGVVAQRTAAKPNAAADRGDQDRRLPAGALGAPVVGGFGAPAAKAARRNSLPAGALREGRPQRQAEQPMQTAARAEAAAQQTRTLEMGGIEPSGLELDIPPANANASARSSSGAPELRGRPRIHAVVDKNALSASMRAVAPAGGSMRAGEASDATSMRASAQSAGASEDGMSLDLEPTDTAFRGSAPLGAGGTLRAGAGAQSKSPLRANSTQAGPRSLRSQAASGDHQHVAVVEGDEAAGEAAASAPDESSSLRPKSGKERRAEARRAARRKAAKHLPPPPSAAPKSALDPAKITLLSFAAVLGIGALGIAAAEAGLWQLPPRAAAMLGIENARASLASAKPGEKPHLVMPAAPAKSMPQPAATPVPAPTPAEPFAPQPSAATRWAMGPSEEPPAPLVLVAPESAAAPPDPTDVASESATGSAAPANLASATAPGTMPAAVAATPKAVVTLSPTAAPNAGDTETEAFTLEEAAAGATTGDRAVSAKLVALARRKLRSRDAAGAAELMLRQVTADPNDHHAMEVLIRAWIALGRGEDAVGYAELIVKKRPRRAGYRVLEGDARLAAGDPAGAQVAWRVALELEPDNREARRRLGLP